MSKGQNRSKTMQIVSNHARLRLFERNVSTDELLAVIAHGEIIETYPDDEPCPSALILGFINHTVHHVVVVFCTEEDGIYRC